MCWAQHDKLMPNAVWQIRQRRTCFPPDQMLAGARSNLVKSRAFRVPRIGAGYAMNALLCAHCIRNLRQTSRTGGRAAGECSILVRPGRNAGSGSR